MTTMTPIRGFFILATISLCAAASIGTDEIKIVANLDVGASEISRDELNRIFLITKTSLQGTNHVEPVLETAGPVHRMFLKEYIGRTDAALMTYYRSLVFTGKASIPKAFRSDSELIEYVAKTKGAIGYVSANANTAGVKTLKVK
jgi:ABC-type phosphate transport system substrate-binding protein